MHGTCVDVRRSRSTTASLTQPGSARASHQVLGTALCESICGHPPVGCCLFRVAMCIDVSKAFRATAKRARATAQNSAGAQCTRAHLVDARVLLNSCAANEDIMSRQRLKGSCVQVVVWEIQSEDLFSS